ILPDQGAVRIQVTVGAAAETGARPVTVHSRAEDALAGTPWIRHARGELVPGAPAVPEADPAATAAPWPPADAVPVEVDGLYDALAGMGIAYGPRFRGVRALWRRGGELFADVAPAEGTGREARRFSVHPALLDAALHPLGLDADRVRLPFSWQRAFCHQPGATSLRVRLTPTGPGAVSVLVTDGAGKPVASVESLALRPVEPEQIAAARRRHQDTLLRVAWQPAAGSGRAGRNLAVLGDDLPGIAAERYRDLAELGRALEAGTPVPDAVFAPFLPTSQGSASAETSRLLALLNAWLADERLAPARLVVVTSGAVATRPDEDVPDLVHAPLWGLVRSAQAEEPDRFVLLDLDEPDTSVRALPTAWNRGEPQLAVRVGTVLVPRLARAATAVRSRPGPLDPNGTVLVTGGLGTLGGLVAAHLVRRHGARHLLLAGRRGTDTPGATELVAHLTALGARVTAAACDVGDREALRRLLAAADPAHPLTGVVHTAGTLDDGVIGSLGPDSVRRVFHPKVSAATHLHELTRDHDLAMFVMFSSASGVLGSAGQANYAAANTFLDALAHHRRASGLPATAVAWGHWAQASEMTGHMGQADLARLSRAGIAPMPSDAALALLDAATASPEPLLVAARLDTSALRTPVPPLLRVLAGASPRRTGTEAPGDPAALRGRLAGLPEPERESALLDLVRTQIAAVLGHVSPTAVPAERRLRDLGFDSLAAVQLRNSLSAATGSRLPATVVFDHPSATALARHLTVLLFGEEHGDDETGGDRPGGDSPGGDRPGGDGARSGSGVPQVTEETVANATDEELFALLDSDPFLGEERARDGR
ncbi:type I polyketide synthase, partial [Streptomyces sp. NPDC019531]|uniref:type I polyketide synthase n=1 Tax=Streptomyces sp. NPDC019531 TaxID=3365062 RepID=UPI00384C106A